LLITTVLLCNNVHPVLGQRCGGAHAFIETKSNFHHSFLELAGTSTARQVPPGVPFGPCGDICQGQNDANGCCPCIALRNYILQSNCYHHDCTFNNGMCSCIPTAASAEQCTSPLGASISQQQLSDISNADGRICDGLTDVGPCWEDSAYAKTGVWSAAAVVSKGIGAAVNAVEDILVEVDPKTGSGSKIHKTIHHCIGKKCGAYRVPIDHPLATKPAFDKKKDYSKKEAAHHKAEAAKNKEMSVR